jgi:hypothetical protein
MARFRPWFTVRRLMVAVALLGIGFGFPVGVARTIAMRHERSDQHASAYLEAREAHRIHPDSVVLGRRVGYHLLMFNKWRISASHPWRPVKPDPPEPK